MSVVDAQPIEAIRQRPGPGWPGSGQVGRAHLQHRRPILLAFWALLVIFPFVWMIVSAFKTDPEIRSSARTLPASVQWDFFCGPGPRHRSAASLSNAARAGRIADRHAVVSAMAAYALARFEFPGRNLIFYGFLAGLMFPVFLALVPLYFLVNNLHLLATYQGLILVYIAYSLPFTIFFLTAFFKTLPSELGEAAILDGANHYQVFFQVMLPPAKPGLIAMGIFNILGQWNQFLLPLVLMPAEEKYLLSQGLYFLSVQQGYQNDYSALFATMVISMIPSLLVYMVFQRRLESGLTAGALKGDGGWGWVIGTFEDSK